MLMFVLMAMLQVTSRSAPEAQLAAVDFGTASVTAAQIKPYGDALNLLGQRCTDNRAHLADMTAMAKKIVKEKGREVKASAILTQVIELTHPSRRLKDDGGCAGAFALVAVTLGAGL